MPSSHKNGDLFRLAETAGLKSIYFIRKTAAITEGSSYLGSRVLQVSSWWGRTNFPVCLTTLNTDIEGQEGDY
jgi:hypothetical protein